jgi:LPS-assembly protein
VEIDEGNLVSLGRFPGRDRIEEGARLDLGLSYSRFSADGTGLALTAGRILRFSQQGQFDRDTGLAGDRSDWLAAAHLDLGQRLSIADRALFDDSLSLRINELRLSYAGDAADLTAAHVWIRSDPLLENDRDVNEISFDAGWRLTERWAARLGGRYDFAASRSAAAALGVSWRTECIEVDVSLSRRFTSSTNVEPQTNVGVEVALLGFGAAGSETVPSRACSG